MRTDGVTRRQSTDVVLKTARATGAALSGNSMEQRIWHPCFSHTHYYIDINVDSSIATVDIHGIEKINLVIPSRVILSDYSSQARKLQ